MSETTSSEIEFKKESEFGGFDRSARDAFLLGLRDASPTYPGVVSFGLITGVTTKAAGIATLPAVVMSFFVFSGTAQLASLQLYAEGATLILILLTAASVNFRYIIYSASLSPYLKEFSLLWRILFSFTMVDQGFAFGLNRFHKYPNLPRRAYYLGISLPLLFIWGSACAAGVIVGAQIPTSWSLEFSLPLVFLALVAMTIKSNAGVLAAFVAGISAIIFVNLPNGLGLGAAAIVGVCAALVSERWLNNKGLNKPAVDIAQDDGQDEV